MIYFGLFLLSIVLTYMIRCYTNKKNILDIPNSRSSHTIPIPRGGGIAIVIVFYLGLLFFKEDIEHSLFQALLCAIPIAITGLMDDIFTISAKVRLLVQGSFAILALYFLGGVSCIDMKLFVLEGWWVNIFAFFIILWLTNLYNFLDGIDGYAASQGIIVGLGLYLFFSSPLGLVIVVACLGFLVFNWHKASIFMGDTGSTTLGFIFALFSLFDTKDGNIYIWLILLSVFWFDATLTLIRRFMNNEVLTQAHKKHAYQRLTQSGWSHDHVVLAATAVNLVFLALLYFVDNVLLVLILNILTLYTLVKLIDKKKGFI